MTPIELSLFALLALLMGLGWLAHIRNQHTLSQLTWDRERDSMAFNLAVLRRDRDIDDLRRRVVALEQAVENKYHG